MRVVGVSGSKGGELELIVKKYWLSAIDVWVIKGIPLPPENLYIYVIDGMH